MGIIKALYDIAIIITTFLILPFWWLSYKKKGYRLGVSQRVLLYKTVLPENAVWIHCASVGEIKTAMPIIEYISSKREAFLTVFSPRAYTFAKDNLNIPVLFLPFDVSFLIEKFIRINRPKILIIFEAELWFNLINTASKHIPIVSLNTNLPKNPKNIFFKYILNRISYFVLKNEDDRSKLSGLIKEKNTKVCGNLKVLSKTEDKQVNIDTGSRKVILAASTHHPEEEIILKTFCRLKKDHPDILLIIAPRHVERLEQIKQLVERYKLSYCLRSETEKPRADVYIVDTIGELSYMYRYSDAVFVGGTVSKVGGHNIFEPILSGKKVIIGENFFKIKDLVIQAEKLNALLVVKDEDELFRAFEKMLKNGNVDLDIKDLQDKVFSCYREEVDRWI